jgi:hypothetical protein
MKVAWIQCGGAAAAAALALLMGVPVRAADTAPGMTSVAAEELDRRSKEAEEAQGNHRGMSDSSVRVLMTYAFSTIPDKIKGPDGKPIKVDKSDPNKYFIPTADARRIIRAATRSAYAEVCGLPDLVRQNYETMMNGERARDTWSKEQLVMINALHVFAASYFTGSIKITTKEISDEDGAKASNDGTTVSKGDLTVEDEGKTQVITSEPPKCPPEQKKKVMRAINAYVKAAQAPADKQ